MITIFRLECEDGNGMYHGKTSKCKFSPWDTVAGEYDPYIQVSPDDDYDLGISARYDVDFPSYRFGFADKKQYHRWVHEKEWREEFDSLGLVLVAYEVPAQYVRFSKHQVAFKSNHATKVKELSPLYFDYSDEY